MPSTREHRKRASRAERPYGRVRIHLTPLPFLGEGGSHAGFVMDSYLHPTRSKWLCRRLDRIASPFAAPSMMRRERGACDACGEEHAKHAEREKYTARDCTMCAYVYVAEGRTFRSCLGSRGVSSMGFVNGRSPVTKHHSGGLQANLINTTYVQQSLTRSS